MHTAIPISSDKITVLVADDHPMIVAGIRNILEREPDIILLPEHASNGREVFEKTSRLKPNVLLMDLRMPGFNPLQAIKTIKAWYDAPEIIVLSSVDERTWIHHTSRAGASGYITKDDASCANKLSDAIRQVVRVSGGLYYSPSAKQKLLAPDPIAYKMTLLQHDVLRLLCDGYDIPEIADKVQRRPNAVHQVLKRLREMFGVQTNHALVREALAQGVIPSPRSDDQMPDPSAFE